MNINENGETLIRRVRNARNVGMELADIQDQFASEFSPGDVYLAWHAACLLDKRSDKHSDKDKETSELRLSGIRS